MGHDLSQLDEFETMAEDVVRHISGSHDGGTR
jgi:hypothetical protein